jgi:hypothetical protein
MKIWVLVLLAALAVLPGCAGRKAGGSSPQARFSETAGVPGPTPQPSPTLIVTPANALIGKVARVNPKGRYVVLNFPVGHLPAVEQNLDVYHLGLKTGEVRVTDLHLDDNVVADLTAGQALAGDEVRDK